MTPLLALWLLLGVIAAWGSAHFAVRDPPATSWMKIAVASFLLLAYAVSLANLRWPDLILGEGLLAHATLVLYWLMTIGGAALCLGSIFGTFVGMFRKTRTERV
jgi:hypothetical protein